MLDILPSGGTREQYDGWTTIDRLPGDERWPWRGRIELVTRDERGRFTSRQVIHNQITDIGRNMVRDALAGLQTNLQINYVAVGSDNGTIEGLGGSNVALGAEFFRKQVTSRGQPATGQNQTIVYVAPFEAVNPPSIQEIGWFAQGTATAGSGIMVARIFYSRSKSNGESLQITRTDSF